MSRDEIEARDLDVVSGTKPARGRPRNPQIEGRIHEAALVLYGRGGWLGFNVDAVARTAGVSKDAIYRRWKSREALLDDALRTRWFWIAEIDTGRIRDDLLTLASQLFGMMSGPYGDVAIQLRVDARRHPEFHGFAADYRMSIQRQARAIVRRAIARGDLPASVKPGLILDLLTGSIMNRIISTPEDRRESMLAEADEFCADIVDVVLAGSLQVLK
jgi:AcrR family transcriptional regulator